MANGLKLEGQRFGHLTVLKKLDGAGKQVCCMAVQM